MLTICSSIRGIEFPIDEQMMHGNVYSSTQGCIFTLDFTIIFSILQDGFLVSGLLGKFGKEDRHYCMNAFLEILMYKLNTSVFLLN